MTPSADAQTTIFLASVDMADGITTRHCKDGCRFFVLIVGMRCTCRLYAASGESEYVAGLHGGTEAGALVGQPAQVLAGECVDPCASLAVAGPAWASHMRAS